MENKSHLLGCLDAKAFTLIELLVVVLIIGILAAVASPQYQKAVWKSRNTQLKTLVKAVAQAREAYYLANGSYPTRFDELAIDLPFTPSNSAHPYVHEAGVDSVRKADDFWLVITSSYNILGFWVTGPYQLTGFVNQAGSKQLRCVEREDADKVNNFCTKLEHGTFASEGTTWKYYTLP